MAAIQCKLEIPSVQGLVDNQLTVGREFILSCQGDFPAGLEIEKLQFVLPAEQKYFIKLLKFEFRSAAEADILATGFAAGDFPFEDLQLSDGVTTVSLGSVHLKVDSTMTDEERQTKQEPYGPYGPVNMDIPREYWAVLAAFLGMILLMVVSKIYRVMQRRRMLERIKEHDAALEPLPQLHQNLRRLQRRSPVFAGVPSSPDDIQECIVESHRMFRLYLLRRFRLPAFEWSDRLVLKDIKRYYPKVFKEHGGALKKLMAEFASALRDKEKVNETDVVNIVNRMRVLVEQMERML